MQELSNELSDMYDYLREEIEECIKKHFMV